MTETASATPSLMPDTFDRAHGQLVGLPDVVQSGRATIELSTTLVGNVETFIVQTFRQWDVGDTIFLQCVSGKGSWRFVIPPAVSALMARQREALSTKSRSKVSKRLAEERKAQGIRPAFLAKPYTGPRVRKPKRTRKPRT